MSRRLDRLADRGHALITGGSSGIGLALARELRDRGCHLSLVGRNESRLESAREMLLSAGTGGPEVHLYPCDVTDAKAVESLFQQLRDRGPLPSILVNSAGASIPGRFHEQPIEEFDAMMAVNFDGTVHTLRHAVPEMIQAREGFILNVASLGALMGVYGMSAYCASKFAVRGLTETLRAELRPHGIVVSLLCPPDTDTPMLELEKLTRPPETEALSGSAGLMTAEAVARITIRGMRREEAEIVPGVAGKGSALGNRLAPGITRWVMDRIVRKVSAD